MGRGDRDFSGSIAELYETILVPFMFEPFARDMAARLAGFDGEVLEIAAGTGVLTRELDRTLGSSARIVATDLNAPMLDVAAARLSSPRVTWRPADALDLPFEGESFAAVACQFGVMFYPDKRSGHAEAARVLRPGGRYLINVWDELSLNPVAEVVHEAVAACFPQEPPDFFARIPHGFYDTAKLRADVEGGGFGEVAIETVTLEAGRLAAEELARGFCQGTPLRNEIEARDQSSLGRVTAAVARSLQDRFGSGPIQSTIQAHVIAAVR